MMFPGGESVMAGEMSLYKYQRLCLLNIGSDLKGNNTSWVSKVNGA